MRRRLWLCALLLVLAVPMFAARRRTVTPGNPDHCVHATLAQFFTSAQMIAVDNEDVYVLDSFGSLVRIPKLGGGDFDLLVFSMEDWLPLSMTVDATHVYIGAMPSDAFFTKEPGAILRVPKTGGVPEVFIEDVRTPFAIASDATHVYWTATGTLDFVGQRIESDGKVERVRNDGTNRQTLAEDLSAPLTLAIDATNVFYSETGIADDDPTIGLFRVAKSGGDIATVDDLIAISLAVDGNTIVMVGGNETEGGIVAIDKNGATPLRVLYATDGTFGSSLRILDRRAYLVREVSEEEEEGELLWINIDTPSDPVVVRGGLYFEDDFALDGCAAIVSTIDGQLLRVGR